MTNFYFEGRKAASRKAKFGRSKEKRSDCRLLVLALCINTDGFIRYSAILEAGTADPKSLPAMVDLSHGQKPGERVGSHAGGHQGAGIASEANLIMLKDKGYNFMCVSRTRLKDYELAPDCRTVTVHDARKQTISLREVCTEPDGDYYLENSHLTVLKKQLHDNVQLLSMEV